MRDMGEEYDPYPETIYIYNNRMSGGGSSPDGIELKALKVAMFGLGGSLPDVLWDGFYNSDKADVDGNLLPDYAICVDNGDAEVLNADLPNDSSDIIVGATQHSCNHDKLPAVILEAPLG